MKYIGSTVECKTGPAEQQSGYEKTKQLSNLYPMNSMASYELPWKRVSSMCTEEAAGVVEHHMYARPR